MRRVLSSLLAGVAIACGPPPLQSVVQGDLGDLRTHLSQLIDAPVEANPILVVFVYGANDRFLQFSVSEDVVQLDYPLISPEQQGRETAVRAALEGADCTPEINRGSDGSRFLDCDLPRSVDSVVQATSAVLESALGVDDSTRLVFASTGLAG